MRQAEADRDSGWSFKRDHYAEHASGKHVDRDRKIWAPNRLTVAFVHDDQIDNRVVDLDLFKRCGQGWRSTTGTLQATGCILTFPPASSFDRIEAINPSGQGIARRDGEILHRASTRNLAMECSDAPLLLGQEALMKELADDAFDLLRQSALAFAPTGLAANHICHQSFALSGATDQDINLPPRQAERLSGDIGSFVTDYCEVRQWSDDLSSAPTLRPFFIGKGRYTAFGYRDCLRRYAQTSIWCTRLTSIA